MQIWMSHGVVAYFMASRDYSGHKFWMPHRMLSDAKERRGTVKAGKLRQNFFG